MTNIQENIERGWADIEGFPGYRITIDGEALSSRSQGSRNGIIREKKWIRLRTQLNHKGYVTVTLTTGEGKAKRISMHRLVAMHFVERDLNRPQVNHIDGNKENNNYRNLEWNTCYENILHCVDKKLRSRQVLTPDKVLEIRQRIADKIPMKEIALLFGVSTGTVSDIGRRRSWKHV